MKLYQRVWGERDELTGDFVPAYLKEVPTIPCTEAHFGWGEEENVDNIKFFPVPERDVN